MHDETNSGKSAVAKVFKSYAREAKESDTVDKAKVVVDKVKIVTGSVGFSALGDDDLKLLSRVIDATLVKKTVPTQIGTLTEERDAMHDELEAREFREFREKKQRDYEKEYASAKKRAAVAEASPREGKGKIRMLK